ncbi:FHA domain-containing protein [Burkholderia cepacia]|uniref:FHA domain-containing protein n=1 Tax=Burkholderia cepacia TaxID=292 RepID=UPI0021586E70|nr:FHA domain-containing protein [Burkholderia cepacia]
MLTGLHTGARLMLDGRAHTLIGRDLACDVTLRDACVADRHVMLVMIDGRIKAVSLSGEIEVNGLALPEGKQRVLHSGERIKLGDVLIGLGEEGTVWEAESGIDNSVVERGMARARSRFRHWLAQSEKRRRVFSLSIYAGAGLCILLPLVLAVVQLSRQNKIEPLEQAIVVKQIKQRLDQMKLTGLKVFSSRPTRAVVVEGYVPFEEDIRRIEIASLKFSMKPTLRLYSRERIERQAQEYVQRDLSDATVRARDLGELQIGSGKAMRPQFKEWLRERLIRDIPGVRTVVFDGPLYSRLQEISPNPYSIMSIGPMRFLLAKSGERLFNGSELSLGIQLNRIDYNSIFIEYGDEKSLSNINRK